MTSQRGCDGASESSNGLFIVIEGLDGAGTTTQTKLLARTLASLGQPVATTSEPSVGAMGSLLLEAITGRIYLSGEALALAFAADRLDHLQSPSGVEHLLSTGTSVISDRYVLSSLAYQASQGVDLGWLMEINRNARTPDVTVFIDTPTKVCLQRIASRGGRSDDIFHGAESLDRVSQSYRRVLSQRMFLGHLVTADGDQLEEAVSSQILAGLMLHCPELQAVSLHTDGM